MWPRCFGMSRSKSSRDSMEMTIAREFKAQKLHFQSHLALRNYPQGPEEALQIVDEAVRGAGGAKICTAQCNCLITLLAQVGECIHKWRRILEAGTSRLAMKLLIDTMDRGLQLLKSCHQESWTFQILLHEESRLEFTEVYEELVECIRLLSLSLRNNTNQKFQPKIMGSEVLTYAAKKDQRDLWRSVEECKEASDMVHRMLLRKSAEARNGIRDNLFIEYKQLQFKKQLNRGSYGTVYEATWLDYTFAVKVFLVGDSSFSRELAALIPLKHPNIVRVVGYSYDSETRRCALVMEKMKMDLGLFIRKLRSSLSVVDAVCIILEVAKAMTLLHSENIIHRDLKPANILVRLGSKGTLIVKVADFGLARTKFVTKEISHATSRVGTKAFRAPEVYDSDNYSKKADVYSFAMVSYFILTGEMPFRNILKSPSFIEMVREGSRPEIIASFPVELVKLLTQCWSAKPENRPEFSEICEKLKVLRGCIVTGSSWDEVEDYEPVSHVLQFFDSGGYDVPSLKTSVKTLGQGSLGTTYQAEINGGSVVAVKWINDANTSSLVAKQQLEMIGRFKHPSVLPLRSYYCTKKECLLVYDHISGGSLAAALHNSAAPLDWRTRASIALSIAKGMAYLHSQTSCCGVSEGFVHGNLHSFNILLDHDRNAFISDAGVSFLLQQSGAQLTQVWDVYSFGMLLVELLTKKAPGLVKYLIQEERTPEVFDTELCENASSEPVQLLRIAMACISTSPPAMERVAGLIEKLGAIKEDAFPRSHQFRALSEEQ